jgi:hypothetical protein
LRHRQKERVHFHERLLSEPGRLSPPIWPCTTRGFPCPRCRHRSGGLLPHLFTLAKRREHFEDVSQVPLCDATALHSAGGLFSVALSVALRVAQALACAPPDSPPGVTRRVALSRVPLTIPQPPFGVCELINVPQDGVRTFLPPSHLAMTKPAITRPARQLYYTPESVRIFVVVPGKDETYNSGNQSS